MVNRGGFTQWAGAVIAKSQKPKKRAKLASQSLQRGSSNCSSRGRDGELSEVAFVAVAVDALLRRTSSSAHLDAGASIGRLLCRPLPTFSTERLWHYRPPHNVGISHRMTSGDRQFGRSYG